MDVFNFIRNHYLALLLVCLTSFLTKLCGRKTRRQDKIKPSNEDQPHPPSDPNYDETQENIQTVEVQEDPLANVRLLTPTLPGGCNDENAAKEAATRHKTNQYFPKLQIQKRRIVNRTTKSELRKMVDQLPPHPPQRYRAELREPALDKRKEKWKNAHVHWHDTGLVFIVRSHDPCRSKDDNGGDTIDSPSKEEQQESTKINSEMPLSDKNAERKTQAKSRRSKEKTPAPPPQSSKKSSKERKLAPTQEETQLSDETKATSVGVTPKTPGIPSTGATSGILTTGPESVKSYRMAGGLIKKPEDPPNFAKKLLETEWREMTVASNDTNETLNTLDMYLRDRAELRSTDHVVISETVDDEDQKSTTRLKILTKFDEGRFAAIYMVQNESAVDNDVVSVGNARFMMKTALRHLSSHQIVYRLSREISALKMLWSKGNDQPQRIPPIHHQGKVLGFPFYVTSIYDVNLEKCREQMGGGSFCVQSAFHIAQEIFSAIKFIHRRQLVHRDIKPTNIVLSYQNRDQWYLIDYGDCITVGKNSALSPPDGITLLFLSLEAHDLLYTTAYSTFQQDLESWFYVLVDLIKPLPWRDNNRIDKVALAKRDFFNRLPIRLSDYPPQVLEIGKLLRSDTQPSYPEISRKLSEGITASKKSMSGEKWNPEWYDRSATKKLKARKPMNKQKRSREVSDAEGTVTTTVDSVESGTNEKKDGSVYISEIRPTPPALNQSNRKKGSSPAPPPSNNPTNKVAQMIDDDEPPQRNQSPVQKQQERSVYFNDFPIVTPDVGGKKKYRYKLKK